MKSPSYDINYSAEKSNNPNRAIIDQSWVSEPFWRVFIIVTTAKLQKCFISSLHFLWKQTLYYINWKYMWIILLFCDYKHAILSRWVYWFQNNKENILMGIIFAVMHFITNFPFHILSNSVCIIPPLYKYPIFAKSDTQKNTLLHCRKIFILNKSRLVKHILNAKKYRQV